MKKIYKYISPTAIIINLGILIYFSFVFGSKFTSLPKSSGGLDGMSVFMSICLLFILALIWVVVVLGSYIRFFIGYILLLKAKNKLTLVACIPLSFAIILSLVVLYIFDYYYLFGFSLAFNLIAIIFYAITFGKINSERKAQDGLHKIE